MSALKPPGPDRGVWLPLVLLAGFVGLAVANPANRSSCGSCGFFLLPGGACPRPATNAVGVGPADESSQAEPAAVAVSAGEARSGPAE